MKTFLSYSFGDLEFVRLVYRHLRQQAPRIDPYFYTEQRREGSWPDQLREALDACSTFVLFLGRDMGNTQYTEMLEARLKPHKLWVRLVEVLDERATRYFADLDPIRVFAYKSESPIDEKALTCAQEIMSLLGLEWLTPDDIPNGYLFDYEKDVVHAYLNSEGHDDRIPWPWPEADRQANVNWIKNPVLPKVIGVYRKENERIVVDARANQSGKPLTFLEAGPRDPLCYPRPGKAELKVGILVSGGIAPGINAVISGIVNRHSLYADPPEEARNRKTRYSPYTLQIKGFIEGFNALLRGGGNFQLLDRDVVAGHVHRGGSMLGTSRAPELLERSQEKRLVHTRKIIQTLIAENIEILYVIGGDGSMRAAHAIQTIARTEYSTLSVVGIPKTMDNDILWVWQSFGFLSAVERSKEAIMHLQTEVQSNPRLCVIQLFGSDSGFVVSHAVLASGGCDYALIPEVGFTMAKLCERIKTILADRLKRDQKAYGMIVMAETAIPRDVEKYIAVVDLTTAEKAAILDFAGENLSPDEDPFKRRIRGQTPDELRTGGLKIVSKVLQEAIRDSEVEYWRGFRVFTNEPRHIIRAIPPSVSDVIFGQRLGTLAVDNAMAGYRDFMTSQWLTEFVVVPLKLVVLGRKRIPPDGIFWKSVLASTKQPVEVFEERRPRVQLPSESKRSNTKPKRISQI